MSIGGIVFLWIVGGIFVLCGGIGYVVCHLCRPLIHAEIAGMKQGGLFEGEPEYMGQFRVTRAQFDLEDNMRHTRYVIFAFLVGVMILAYLIAYLIAV